MQTGEGHLLDHLWHGDFGIFFKGIHHEPIATDIIHTLETERILGSEPILHTGTQTHLEPSKPDHRMFRLQGHCLRKGKAHTASFKFWKSSDLGGLTRLSRVCFLMCADGFDSVDLAGVFAEQMHQIVTALRHPLKPVSRMRLPHSDLGSLGSCLVSFCTKSV